MAAYRRALLIPLRRRRPSTRQQVADGGPTALVPPLVPLPPRRAEAPDGDGSWDLTCPSDLALRA